MITSRLGYSLQAHVERAENWQNLTDNYGPIPESVCHYWPFDDYLLSGPVVGDILDVVGGYHIEPIGISNYGYPGAQLYHSGVDVGERAAPNNTHFECFNGTDWMIIISSKSFGNGNFEFTIGDSSELPRFKIQPYYLSIRFGTDPSEPWSYVATPFYYPLATRTVAVEYTIVLLKRGNSIEHWVNGVLVGSKDLKLLLGAEGRTHGDDAVTAYNDTIPNARPTARIRLGHSANGDITTVLTSSDPDYDYPYHTFESAGTLVQKPSFFASVANEQTEYASVLIASYTPGGMPENVADISNWFATEWFSGNKTADCPFL